MKPFWRSCDCGRDPTCPNCHGHGEYLDRKAIYRRIHGHQQTMEYASPEVCRELQAEIERLLALDTGA